jgi:hypothetical protein
MRDLLCWCDTMSGSFRKRRRQTLVPNPKPDYRMTDLTAIVVSQNASPWVERF